MLDLEGRSLLRWLAGAGPSPAAARLGLGRGSAPRAFGGGPCRGDPGADDARAWRAAGLGRLLPRRHDGGGRGRAGAGARQLRRSPRHGISPAFRTKSASPAAAALARLRRRLPKRWAHCRWKCCKAPSGASIRRARSPSSRPLRTSPEGPQAAAFVALEDWANDGPPMPLAAARELFEDLLERDAAGAGEWLVGGRAIDPAACRALAQHRLDDRPDRAAGDGDSSRRADRARSGPCRHGRRRQGAGSAVAAAGRVAFAGLTDLLGAIRLLPVRLSRSKPFLEPSGTLRQARANACIQCIRRPRHDRSRHHRRQAHARRRLPRRLRRHARPRARPGRDRGRARPRPESRPRRSPK